AGGSCGGRGSGCRRGQGVLPAHHVDVFTGSGAGIRPDRVDVAVVPSYLDVVARGKPVAARHPDPEVGGGSADALRLAPCCAVVRGLAVVDVEDACIGALTIVVPDGVERAPVVRFDPRLDLVDA